MSSSDVESEDDYDFCSRDGCTSNHEWNCRFCCEDYCDDCIKKHNCIDKFPSKNTETLIVIDNDTSDSGDDELHHNYYDSIYQLINGFFKATYSLLYLYARSMTPRASITCILSY